MVHFLIRKWYTFKLVYTGNEALNLDLKLPVTVMKQVELVIFLH